ncbi:unnamed protein product [Ixodes pacificus]
MSTMTAGTFSFLFSPVYVPPAAFSFRMMLTDGEECARLFFAVDEEVRPMQKCKSRSSCRSPPLFSVLTRSRRDELAKCCRSYPHNQIEFVFVVVFLSYPRFKRSPWPLTVGTAGVSFETSSTSSVPSTVLCLRTRSGCTRRPSVVEGGKLVVEAGHLRHLPAVLSRQRPGLFIVVHCLFFYCFLIVVPMLG